MAWQGAMGIEEIISKKVASFRHWKKTKLFKRNSRWDFQFTVMTYNVLSQRALNDHRNLYQYCNHLFLHEEYRVSRLFPEILRSGSDIICLQEVEYQLYDNRFKTYFDSNGFSSIYKRRTGCKSDGCAILWRRNKFQLVNHRDIEFAHQSTKPLDRDNVGLIAVFRPNHPKLKDTLLHVATTHLLFNPKRADIKMLQLRWLLAELDNMSCKRVSSDGSRHHHPVVLCGDLNLEPHSPMYHFLETGSLEIERFVGGDLAGQKEGKGRGQSFSAEDLVLRHLGITNGSVYEVHEHRLGKDRPGVSSDQEKNESGGSSRQPLQNLPPAKIELVNTAGIDPNLLAAMQNSNDPRWVDTLNALGYKDLAAEYADRLRQNQPVNFKKSEESRKIVFSHPFNFVPVYKYYNTSPRDLPITSMTSRDFNNVDHIFYNVYSKKDPVSFVEGKLRLLSSLSLMSVDEIKEIGGLPNAHLGSDHTSLRAQFALCENQEK